MEKLEPRAGSISAYLKKKFDGQEPIRSELFDLPQMKQYAILLAGRHISSESRMTANRFRKMAGDKRVLLKIHALLGNQVYEMNYPAPEVEWFLNNFHLIRNELDKEVRWPRKHRKHWKLLASGPSAGFPRIYDMAKEVIAHRDGQLEPECLKGFLKAYQSVSVLSLNELTAFSLMLRLVLTENIRRIVLHMAASVCGYDKDGARKSDKPDAGKSRRTASDWASLRNSIISFRVLNAIDWNEFISGVSLIEPILAKDSSGIYAKMDHSTRHNYRKNIESISIRSGQPALEVARLVIRMAKEQALKNNDKSHRMAHVGYYLADAGKKDLEKILFKDSVGYAQLREWVRKHSFLLYAGIIAMLTGSIAWSLWAGGIIHNRNPLLLAGYLLYLYCSLHIAISLTHSIMKLYVKPVLLPRLDFSSGIPAEARTLVIIPSLLTDEKELNLLVNKLEVYYLANKDENLHFGLLTDFPDAASENIGGDGEMMQLAKRRMEQLNEKYPCSKNTSFFLFHRPRRWNPSQQIWMGYERKRGKLMELNALLRGKGRDRFSLIVGEEDIFPDIKYVITLDSDTRLPMNSARVLTGALAHPLNRGVYCEKSQRVTEGYAILQPRVAAYLDEHKGSFYKHIHENDKGIDPYTLASADIYQDLFGEGSFIGKGIYDVDLVLKALENKLPENRILSHDLVEGCYARTGLLSDLRLYEAYPSGYLADMKRRHRWVRGDWQIGAWIWPRIPDAVKNSVVNPLTALARWKIGDNLRRSLMPAVCLSLFIVGWTVPGLAVFNTVFVTLLLMLPFLTEVVEKILANPWDFLVRQHWTSSIRHSMNGFFRAVLSIGCLPYEAYCYTNAILLSNWRVLFSGKNMLEWDHSGSAHYNQAISLIGTYRKMWISPVLGTSLFLYFFTSSPAVFAVACPILASWMAAPGIIWLISQPARICRDDLKKGQIIFLREIARKTWLFFEKFVTAEENWLPPDHYQDHPIEKTAHYTSPTNIGLSLLANLTAWDFGYLVAGGFLERTGNTMRNMMLLERYKGHFYNWYDTCTLEPSPPRYVSTVDSGNLAGHLLVLRQGIGEMGDRKILEPNLFQGLKDTIRMLENETSVSFETRMIKEKVDRLVAAPPLTLSAAKHAIGELTGLSDRIADSYRIERENDAYQWVQSLLKQCRAINDELLQLVPWLFQPSFPVKMPDLLIPEEIPTLNGLNGLLTKALHKLNGLQDLAITPDEQEWITTMKRCFRKAQTTVQGRIENIKYLGELCRHFADMDYEFLYDKSLALLSIGYNADTGRRDTGFYDLLASEARLASFVGIAQGKLPQKNWHSLGRSFAGANGEEMLISWSGTMFEYLMPLLVMPSYKNSLLDQTYESLVKKQIKYGKTYGVPWGISECCNSVADANGNYQYSAFGIQGLGMKRVLGNNLVIAPYATSLALMIDPEKACSNLKRLTEEGCEGKYGLYEAIDYTPSRLINDKGIIVRSFMVHHQGMSFLSLAYLLLDQPMQKRFEADPSLQSILLLLQESTPEKVIRYFPHYTGTGFLQVRDTSMTADVSEPAEQIFQAGNTSKPAV